MADMELRQTGWMKRLWHAARLGTVLLTPLWVWGTIMAAHEKLRPYLPNPELERAVVCVAVATIIVAALGLAAVFAVWRDRAGRRFLDAHPMGVLSLRLMRATVIGQYAAIAVAVAAIVPVLRHSPHEVRVATTLAFSWMILATIPVVGMSHHWQFSALRNSYKEMLIRR